MNNPYDVHTWSKLYREEALAEASGRRLDRRDVGRARPTYYLLVAVAVAAILLGASGCTSASGSSGPVTPEEPTENATEDNDATDGGYTEKTATSPSPESQPEPAPERDTPELIGVFNVVRATNDFSGGSVSVECYEFYSDGSVLQYRNGAGPMNAGSYAGGQIAWRTGQYSSVAQSGSNLMIGGEAARPSLGDSCRIA